MPGDSKIKVTQLHGTRTLLRPEDLSFANAWIRDRSVVFPIARADDRKVRLLEQAHGSGFKTALWQHEIKHGRWPPRRTRSAERSKLGCRCGKPARPGQLRRPGCHCHSQS